MIKDNIKIEVFNADKLIPLDIVQIKKEIRGMVVVTYIYSHNERTKQMIESFKRFGYEIAVIETDTHRGNGTALKLLGECYQRASTGHINFVYADAADSYCQRSFFSPYDKIIYQTEKACYPHAWVANKYPTIQTKYIDSQWRYLNGGGYCGSTKLIAEFFDSYGLMNLPSEANGQHEQMLAYIKAKEEGFPIFLDDGCELFQSMAFEDEGDFKILTYNKLDSVAAFNNIKASLCEDVNIAEYKVVVNNKTNNVPAVLHFNGCTDMSILNELK